MYFGIWTPFRLGQRADSLHQLRKPPSRWPGQKSCVLISHLQRKAGMANVVAVHNRQRHGEVGPLHIRQMDGQKILYTALEHLRNREVPVAQRLSASQLHRRFQQQGQVPCRADGFGQPRHVLLIIKDVARVDTDFPFWVVVRHFLPQQERWPLWQQLNAFEPRRVVGRKSFEAPFS